MNIIELNIIALNRPIFLFNFSVKVKSKNVNY